MLLCFNCAVFSASSIDVTDESIYKEKISPNLQSSLEQLGDDEKVKVAVWLYDIDDEVKSEALTNKLKERNR